jgi:hypothetical protein
MKITKKLRRRRVARFIQDTITQNGEKYTKLALNDQMAIKYTKWI